MRKFVVLSTLLFAFFLVQGMDLSEDSLDNGFKRFFSMEEAAFEQATPSLLFSVQIPRSGIYELATEVERIEDAYALLKSGIRVADLSVVLQLNDQRETRRVVSDARNLTHHVLGKFYLSEGHNEIKIRLPEGIVFRQLEVRDYVPPAVPKSAVAYRPRYLPPPKHPRLWVNTESVSLVRSRLQQNEHLPVWLKLKEEALSPLTASFDPEKEIFHDEALEKQIEKKAFYYLMTGDVRVGKEAVDVLKNYLFVLEFGNIKHGDITREIGRSIYIASLTYDWCYDLLTESDKAYLLTRFMYLAAEMEIGWPPFKESVVSGHGNEAQVNRDLLAMSIAVYNEDPVPYQYTSYLLLEHLVPMKAFEYQSPRHNQGIDYGAYRHMWEMHAAWMFYRMSGVHIFDRNINDLWRYWVYMRLPDGDMLRDGDRFQVPRMNRPFYWKQPKMTFLDYTYTNNPLLKAEFERQGGLDDDPVLFLLLNKPDLKPDPALTALDLSLDCGSILGGLIVRTGWDMSEDSQDVVAEIKGGGYHFGNHQHSDAGSIQVYYRGLQVCDLGLYSSYGTPYDFNFNKRSIAHNTILVPDPNEALPPRSGYNDGGSRFNQRVPLSPEETVRDAWFDNGEVISVGIGPQRKTPLYSYFKVDLSGAYSDKIERYTRSFCFLNLKRKDVPAVILLADYLELADKDLPCYLMLNTLKEPIIRDSTVVFRNSQHTKEGNTYIQSLLPVSEARTIDAWSRTDSACIFGKQYKLAAALPEAKGYQVAIASEERQSESRFLTCLQLVDGGERPLPVSFYRQDTRYIVALDNKIVCLSSNANFIRQSFSLDIPEGAACQLILTDLHPGTWSIVDKKQRKVGAFTVLERDNCIAFEGKAGETYRINFLE